MVEIIDAIGLRAQTPRFRQRLVRRCLNLGLVPDWVAATIAFESGFDHRAVNPYSKAVGLIQWTTIGAESQGTTRFAIASLSAEQQLDLALSWFARALPLPSPQDYYLCVFAPAGVRKPAGTPLYKAPSKAYEQNTAMDVDGDGVITVGDVSKKFLGSLNAAMGRPRLIVVTSPTGHVAAGLSAIALIAAGLRIDRLHEDNPSKRDRWREHRGVISDSMLRERRAKDARNERVGEARQAAASAVAGEHERRRLQRDAYRAGKMSVDENDSLAEHNVRSENLELWREVRQRFAYTLPPDHRVELFSEWLEEHPGESMRLLAERADAMDFAAAEAEYYGEAAPF